MTQKENSGVIRLNQEACHSMSVMLKELFKEDEFLKINNSKLASFIIFDFHQRNFEKARSKLVLAYQDKKKHLKDKIEGLDQEELDAAIKYLDKIKKPQDENPVSNE